MQVPRPSQLGAVISVAAVQLRPPHEVPSGCSWQAPAPSHTPVRPQLLASSAGQPFWRGGPPAPTAWQEPALPGRLQARQGPAQEAVSQQTPSTQLPELQSPLVAQATPSGFLPHEPPVQMAPGAQSEGPLQLSLHPASAHR
jgi:hypothetical protein